jgi:hypothetical protein
MFGFSSFADAAFADVSAIVVYTWDLVDDSQPSSWVPVDDTQPTE